MLPRAPCSCALHSTTHSLVLPQITYAFFEIKDKKEVVTESVGRLCLRFSHTSACDRLIVRLSLPRVCSRGQAVLTAGFESRNR